MTTQTKPEFEEARKYVIKNERELRNRYGNSYIAVLGNGVIDSDADEVILAKRVFKKIHTLVNPMISTIDDMLNPEIEFMGGPLR